jgi:nucleoid DNA-binding protein
MVLLNQKDWISMFKARAGLGDNEAKQAFDAMRKALIESLSAGNVAKIPGLGELRRSFAKPRSQYVAHLGRFCDVPASYNHSFKPTKSLKTLARRDAETCLHAGA